MPSPDRTLNDYLNKPIARRAAILQLQRTSKRHAHPYLQGLLGRYTKRWGLRVDTNGSDAVQGVAVCPFGTGGSWRAVHDSGSVTPV